jgi:hypothetical protein
LSIVFVCFKTWSDSNLQSCPCDGSQILIISMSLLWYQVKRKQYLSIIKSVCSL